MLRILAIVFIAALLALTGCGPGNALGIGSGGPAITVDGIATGQAVYGDQVTFAVSMSDVSEGLGFYSVEVSALDDRGAPVGLVSDSKILNGDLFYSNGYSFSSHLAANGPAQLTVRASNGEQTSTLVINFTIQN